MFASGQSHLFPTWIISNEGSYLAAWAIVLVLAAVMGGIKFSGNLISNYQNATGVFVSKEK